MDLEQISTEPIIINKYMKCIVFKLIWNIKNVVCNKYMKYKFYYYIYWIHKIYQILYNKIRQIELTKTKVFDCFCFKDNFKLQKLFFY